MTNFASSCEMKIKQLVKTEMTNNNIDWAPSMQSSAAQYIATINQDLSNLT